MEQNNETPKVEMPSKIRAEYLWLGLDIINKVNNINVRSELCSERALHSNEFEVNVQKKIFHTKVRTIHYTPEQLTTGVLAIPNWSFDGTSTGHITSHNDNSEIILKVSKVFKHPFGLDVLVLCECFINDNTAHPLNTRNKVIKTFVENQSLEPLYGLEQEYIFMDSNGIYGWENYPEQKDYYCGTKPEHSVLRKIVNEHYLKCLSVGVNLSGYNAEVMPSQWEFQVGPSLGINVCDELIIARFILERLANEEKLYINYHPKPLQNYNGSGCHHNFSTVETRLLTSENYKDYYNSKFNSMKNSHTDTLTSYGEFNNERLTGIYETSNMNDFTFGFGTRHTSIRVSPYSFIYFEDRRPASNCDPYLSCEALLKSFIQ